MMPTGPDPRFGTPNENATHWGMNRQAGTKWVRCEWADGEGVLVREWPLTELTLENVRDRWGSGRFKATWLRNDPNAQDARDRRRPEGHGTEVSILVEPEEPIAPPASTGGPGDMLRWASSLMAEADARAARQVELLVTLAGVRQPAPAAPAPAAPSEASTALAEELAKLRASQAKLEARIEADAAAREVEERHRRELAERDERIRELERERDAGDGRVLDPSGGSIVSQLGFAFANGVAKIVAERPDIVARVVEAISSKSAPPPAPPPPPPPQPPPLAARPRPQPAPPPAPAAEATASSEWPSTTIVSDAPSPAKSAPAQNGARIPIVGFRTEQPEATQQ